MARALGAGGAQEVLGKLTGIVRYSEQWDRPPPSRRERTPGSAGRRSVRGRRWALTRLTSYRPSAAASSAREPVMMFIIP